MRATRPAAGLFAPFVARTWLCHHLYGWKFAPNIASYDKPFGYVKSMLFTATADSLSSTERRYIQGLVEVLGVSSVNSAHDDVATYTDLINFVEHAPRYNDTSATTDSSPAAFLSGAMSSSPVLSRVMLYDAVRAATADGIYDGKEQAHVQKVGKQLGIPRDVVRNIELLAKKEAVVAGRKRMLLLGRKGAPLVPTKKSAMVAGLSSSGAATAAAAASVAGLASASQAQAGSSSTAEPQSAAAAVALDAKTSEPTLRERLMALEEGHICDEDDDDDDGFGDHSGDCRDGDDDDGEL